MSDAPRVAWCLQGWHLVSGLVASGLMVLTAAYPGSTHAAGSVTAWRLVWADEFDQPDGSGPDPAKWAYDLGGGGWGNNELETYTARPENARIEGGKLVIEARQESFVGTDGRRREYTSARLKTQDRAEWTYGRLEARLQVPAGQGLWPAFWMIGADIGQVGWPACGEVDIMENIGREPSLIHGTAHGPGYSGGNAIGGPFALPASRRFADGFHLFALQWEPGRMRWSVDNQVYFTLTPSVLPRGGTWVFDKPQFLVLNVAVGGYWPGNPDGSTVFPQKLLVEYVRVYDRVDAPAPALRTSLQAGRPVLLWPASFPQARLQKAPTPTGPWAVAAFDGARTGEDFVAEAAPGFYRLSIPP